jgi:uncharacterized protein YbaR (Trm112 family)
VQAELLNILLCPVSRAPLLPAGDLLVARLNAAIRAGRARNRAGRRVEKPLDGGLKSAAGNVLYPIVDQIPVLLADEAIILDSTLDS